MTQNDTQRSLLHPNETYWILKETLRSFELVRRITRIYVRHKWFFWHTY